MLLTTSLALLVAHASAALAYPAPFNLTADRDVEPRAQLERRGAYTSIVTGDYVPEHWVLVSYRLLGESPSCLAALLGSLLTPQALQSCRPRTRPPRRQWPTGINHITVREGCTLASVRVLCSR